MSCEMAYLYSKNIARTTMVTTTNYQNGVPQIPTVTTTTRTVLYNKSNAATSITSGGETVSYTYSNCL